MELSEEFRRRAQHCLKLAQEAPTLEAQTHWLSMAQLWLNLAQHAEEQESAFIRDASPSGKNGDNGHSNGDAQPDT